MKAAVEPPPRFLFYLPCNTPVNRDVLPPPSWKRSLKWQVFVTIPRWTTCAQNPIRQRYSHAPAAASSQMLRKSSTSRLFLHLFLLFPYSEAVKTSFQHTFVFCGDESEMRIRIQTLFHNKAPECFISHPLTELN